MKKLHGFVLPLPDAEQKPYSVLPKNREKTAIRG
jgi:hypothetical protein